MRRRGARHEPGRLPAGRAALCVERPKDVVALQQQLKAARTRVHNLTIEKNVAWRARDEARKANPIAITKADLAALRKVFHPDPEHDTATVAHKAQLNAVAAIFNEIARKFRVLDRD